MKASKRKWIERGVKTLGWDRKDLDRAYRDKSFRKIIIGVIDIFSKGLTQPEIMKSFEKNGEKFTNSEEVQA